MTTPIGVLGAGSFGTCLAILAAQENDVTLWVRNPDDAEVMRDTGFNPKYLSDVPLPDSLTVTSDIAETVRDKEIIICAVPSHGVRSVLEKAAPDLHPDTIVVSTIKGIESGSCKLMHEVFADCLSPEQHARLVVLSGPSFAREVAEKQPTLVTVACQEENYAIAVQSTLSCPWFRCYSQTDVLGVELGGALKNVVAIAVGIGDGLGLGSNARAALMTRGLAEITRLGIRLGADPRTFLGLAGMGDLVLTCTGDLSRNRHVGLMLGKGQSLEEILSGMNQVAEGVRTAESAWDLSQRVGVDMPIVEAVRSVILGERSAADAVHHLMSRQLKSESE
jgi:glycerol-3-phosphate dehydrogenase (NAD(P)+)